MRPLEDVLSTCNSPEPASFSHHVFRVTATSLNSLEGAPRQDFLDNLRARSSLLRGRIIADVCAEQMPFMHQTLQILRIDREKIVCDVMDLLEQAFSDELQQ